MSFPSPSLLPGTGGRAAPASLRLQYYGKWALHLAWAAEELTLFTGAKGSWPRELSGGDLALLLPAVQWHGLKEKYTLPDFVPTPNQVGGRKVSPEVHRVGEIAP